MYCGSLKGPDMGQTSKSCLLHDIFTNFNSTFSLSVALRVMRRGGNVLEMPVFCKLCKIRRIVLWAVFRNHNLRYAMTAELHFQLVDDCSGIYSLQLVNFKKMINNNQWLSGTVAHQTATGLFQPSARALMELRVASVALEAALACRNCKHHT